MQSFKLKQVVRLPLAWAGLALIAILWFGISYQIDSELSGARKSADQELRNFSRVFDEHIVRTVRDLDKALVIAKKRYRTARETMSYEEAIGQRLPDPALLSNISFQMATIDRNGVLRATTIGKHPPEPIDLQDREHFKVHKTDRPDTPYISKPVLGRKSGRWSVQLTRRIEGPDGSFDGVLVASMDPALFGRFYRSIELGERGAVIFAGLDGFIRVVSGAERFRLGDDISDTLLMGNARKGDGVYQGDMDGSGMDRIYAVRRIPGYPLFVAAGISSDAVFASTASNQTRYIIAGLIASLLVVLAVAASIRHHLTIAYMARYDDLTGLANRALFRETVEASLTEVSRGRAFTMFLIDIDQFKSANDTFGHSFGDKLLCAISKRLQKAARKSDLVARLGGDEFAVIMNDLKDPTEVAERANGLLQAVQQPVMIDGQRIVVTGSAGSETVTDRKITPEIVLKNADLALYEAKSSGRNCHKPFAMAMAEKFAEKRELEDDLRGALEGKQLQLHYQAIQSLNEGKVCCFEALLRWNHPERGWISPIDFIPIAEETGLIIPIGAWVLNEACRQTMKLAPDKRVSVNLSPVQFRDPDLVNKISSALKSSGLPPERLELEITESLMMQAASDTVETIRQIRGLGITIAMDDFGTGYSSLGYLCSFEFDKIKIDRSFVVGLDKSENYSAIIRTIIGLAKSLNVSTTVEGIETLKQLEAVKTMGCTEAQGFLFSPPQPIERLQEFMDYKPNLKPGHIKGALQNTNDNAIDEEAGVPSDVQELKRSLRDAR